MAVTSAIIELASIFFIDRRLSREHNWLEKRGTFGDQIGEWLLESDGEGQPNNLDVLSSRFASAMVGNINRVDAGMKSGEVRHQKMIDNKIFGAMSAQNPDMRIVTRILTELGLEDLANAEDLPYVLNWLRKNQGLGFSPQQHSSSNQQSNKGRMQY